MAPVVGLVSEEAREKHAQASLGHRGTRPYRCITAINAALSGGPPALITVATSSNYFGPMSGARVISARATLLNGFEKPCTEPLGVRMVWPGEQLASLDFSRSHCGCFVTAELTVAPARALP